MAKKKKNTKKTRKFTQQEKQLIGFFAIVAFVFAVFLGIYFYVQNLNHFDYVGVEWNKVKVSQMSFYYSQFRLADNLPIYNAYLRNDPRKNEVVVDADFKFRNRIVLSYSDDESNCSGYDVYLGTVAAQFIKAMGSNVTGASTNAEKAKEQNITFADCSTAGKKQSVIIVRPSEIASITQSEENPECYYMNTGKCQQIETVEKFIVAVLAQTSGEKL
jgi:hypothetical protein